MEQSWLGVTQRLGGLGNAGDEVKQHRRLPLQARATVARGEYGVLCVRCDVRLATFEAATVHDPVDVMGCQGPQFAAIAFCALLAFQVSQEPSAIIMSIVEAFDAHRKSMISLFMAERWVRDFLGPKPSLT